MISQPSGRDGGVELRLPGGTFDARRDARSAGPASRSRVASLAAQPPRRVALVGAGFIAGAHAEALRSIPGVRLSAVIDPSAGRARALAEAQTKARPQHGADDAAPAVFASVEAALEAGAFDCAHVLVPPPQHRDVASRIIAAGRPVLVEKPMAVTAEECRALVAEADGAQVALGVNQNFVHHPALVRLKRLVDARALGPPRAVDCLYNVPLRQLAARQLGHWMFASPRNLLLEQAVHPLSQVVAVAGPILDVRAIAGAPLDLVPGRPVYRDLSAILTCRDLPAQLRFAVGQTFPIWQLRIVCEDGVAVADVFQNRVYTIGRTRWMDAVDGLLSAGRTAGQIAVQAGRGFAAYTLAQFGLGGASDPFFRSMQGSIAAFHAALDAGTAPALDGRFGLAMVEACERLCTAAAMPEQPAADHKSSGPRAASAPFTPDIAVLGGTGFIGTHLVRRALVRGLRVAVMARSVAGLPDAFLDSRVRLCPGDIGNPDAVARAIQGAPMVINLAHGGGGGSWEEIRAAMVGGAEIVARAALATGARRLVHVGSIASLYLGPQPRAVTGATPPDPRADRRADYARAKAACDRLLLDLYAREGLPVCILRPGLVVGEGASPFHGGLGFFNNDQHGMGWNAGRNRLPFVLVEDVAEAILLACEAQTVDGRCYNLVGDVRISAREYIAALGNAIERPLRFHPHAPSQLWAAELCKWAVKRLSGRRAPIPALRDLASRGLRAEFDCSDARRDLGWAPVADPATFHARAIAVHAG